MARRDDYWNDFSTDYRNRQERDQIWQALESYLTGELRSHEEVGKRLGHGSHTSRKVGAWFQSLGFKGRPTGILQELSPQEAHAIVAEYRQYFERKFWPKKMPPPGSGNEWMKERLVKASMHFQPGSRPTDTSYAEPSDSTHLDIAAPPSGGEVRLRGRSSMSAEGEDADEANPAIVVVGGLLGLGILYLIAKALVPALWGLVKALFVPAVIILVIWWLVKGRKKG